MKLLVYLLAFPLIVFADWTVSGEVPAYPKAMYFVGLGSSTDSPEEASKKAMAEIKKQISVQIKTKQYDSQESEFYGGKEHFREASSSHTRAMSSGELVGAEIVKRSQEKSTYFALAVLDKFRFAEIQTGLIEKSNQEVNDWVSKAQSVLSENKLALALEYLNKASAEYENGNQFRKLIQAVDYSEGVLADPISLPMIHEISESLIKDLTLVMDGVNEQEIAELKDWQAVQIRAQLRGDFVSQLKLRIYEGRTVLTEFTTNEKGQIELKDLTELNPLVGKHHLEIVPVLRVSSALKKQLRRQGLRLDYEVKAKYCPVQLSWKNNNQNDPLEQKIFIDFMQKAGFDLNEKEGEVWNVWLDIKKENEIEGLSKSMSLAQYEISLSVQNQGVSVIQSAKGLGNSKKQALAKAFKTMDLSKELRAKMAKFCQD